MDFRHSGAVGDNLAVADFPGAIGGDHRGIAEDHFDQLLGADRGLTDGDRLPALEPLELGERETIRHLHRILVLRRQGDAPQGGKTENCDRWDRDARHNNLHTLSARC